MQDPEREVWVFGTWTGRSTGVEFGIEKFFFTEGRETEFTGIRSGSFWVEATVSRAGRLAIKKLVR